MVKISEAIFMSYCDFCTLPEDDTRGRENTGSAHKLRNRKNKSYYSRSICKRDLCEGHCYSVNLPRIDGEDNLNDFWPSKRCRPHYLEGKICPECANRPLGEIGIALLKIRHKEDSLNTISKE